MLVLTALVLLNGVWDLIPQINIGREPSDLRSTNLRAGHGKVP